MSVYCRGCGTHHEEDDGRLCARCQATRPDLKRDVVARFDPSPKKDGQRLERDRFRAWTGGLIFIAIAGTAFAIAGLVNIPTVVVAAVCYVGLWGICTGWRRIRELSAEEAAKW